VNRRFDALGRKFQFRGAVTGSDGKLGRRISPRPRADAATDWVQGNRRGGCAFAMILKLLSAARSLFRAQTVLTNLTGAAASPFAGYYAAVSAPGSATLGARGRAALAGRRAADNTVGPSIFSDHGDTFLVSARGRAQIRLPPTIAPAHPLQLPKGRGISPGKPCALTCRPARPCNPR